MAFTLTLTRRAVAAFAFAAAGAVALPAASLAQAYPTRPIRIVVPAPPGGTLDLIARILNDDLSAALGQPVIVESKPGGAGMIGVQDLLASQHDGYTVLIHISGIASEIPHLVKPPYDPFKDIKPLVEVANSGLVFVGAPNLPANSLKDVIAYVKANPGKVNYASYSAGTVSHTLGIELNAKASLDMAHVAYKGSPPALQDLMGGHVQLMFDGPATSIPLITGGKIKAFAVTTPQRMPALPDVATFAELGFPSLTQVAWVGLWVAPDVPAAVQDKLRSETLRILQKPAARERLAALGMAPGAGASSDDLAKALRTAFDRQGVLLQSVNFTPQ